MVGERQGNSMGTAGERHGNGRGTAWEQHGNGMVCVNPPLGVRVYTSSYSKRENSQNSKIGVYCHLMGSCVHGRGYYFEILASLP
jgi:hypothetical protein